MSHPSAVEFEVIYGTSADLITNSSDPIDRRGEVKDEVMLRVRFWRMKNVKEALTDLQFCCIRAVGHLLCALNALDQWTTAKRE